MNENEAERVELELIGITYNQIESGVYALILKEKNGTRRVPIIIGYPEAQAIECKLQEVVTPRPLTHDLIVNLMSTFSLSLKEIDIYRLPNGVFAANIIVCNNSVTHCIDARSSDAIAMAIRVGAPIYTTRQMLEEAGFSPEESTVGNSKKDTLRPSIDTRPATIEKISDQELQQRLETAIANENYEEAARIKNEMDRRAEPSCSLTDSSDPE